MPDLDYESLSDNSTSGSESYKKNLKVKKTKNIQNSEQNIQESEEKPTSLEEIFKKKTELLETELLETKKEENNKEIIIFEEKEVIKNTRTIRISNRSLLLLKR